MIREDEFTNSKSNNDSFISKSEYGNTQDSEYSDSGEMNLHKAAYDASLMKSQNTTKMVEDVTQGTSTAIESTVGSSTAASGIAASTVGVITVASTVAIGALGVLTGVSLTSHDYTVVLDSMRIIGDSMSYCVSVYDQDMTEEDYEEYFRERYENYDQDQPAEEEEEMTYPFVVKLYNNNYSASMPADYLSNEGYFSHITVGDTYTIEVSEDRFGGDILYETTFVATYSYSFDEFSFPVNVDLENGTFDVYMDFMDDSDTYSDLTLYIYDLELPDEINYTFNLEKVTGYQTIIGPNSPDKIDVFKDWGYRFTFKENGELITYKEDIAHFEDMYGRKSGFNEFVFDRTFSYKEGTMEVRLDYDNDFGWYDNFVLSMHAWYESQDTQGDDESYDFDIELESVTTVQVLNVFEYEMNLETPYTYELTCEYQGEKITLEEETTKFYFSDNSGAKSEWYGFEFDKTANFLEDSFDVRLDYIDDFGRYYNFVLTLLPNGVNAQYDFYLDSTDEVQTCTFDEQQHWNYSFDYEYSYTLTAYYIDEQVTLDRSEDYFKFADNSGFHGLVFDGTFDYGNRTFDLRLDYEDPNGYFSDFMFRLFDEDYPEEPYCEIPLEAVSTVQTIDMDTYDISTSSTWFNYSLACSYKGNTVVLAHSEESFQFYDLDMHPTADITFINNEINYTDGSLWVQLDITDKYNFMSDIYITFYGRNNDEQDEYENEYTCYLDNTDEPQQVTIERNNEDTDVNFIKYGVAYNVFWTYYTEEDEDTGSLYSDPKPITLTNSAKTVFNGVTSKYQVYQSTYAGSGEEACFMYIKFDYTDENNMWSSFKAYWEGKNDNGSTFSSADINLLYDRDFYGWHRVHVSSESGEFGGMPIFDGNGYDLVIIADYNNPYTGESEVDREIYRVENTHPTFGGADREIFKATLTDIGYDGTDYNLTVMELLYHNSDFGEYDYYVNVSFIFEDEESGAKYTYSLPEFSDYFDINFSNFDDGPVDPSEEWDGKYFTVTIHYSITSDPYDSNPTITGPYDCVIATHRKFAISV